MPRVISSTEIDQAIEARRSGKTFEEIAANLGRTGEAWRVAFQRRGIELPPIKRPSPRRLPHPGRELIDLFLSGESVMALMRRYGVARGVVVRWLEESGVQRRGCSEAGKIRASRMTPEERSRQASKAGASMAGRQRAIADKVAMARGRQRTGYGGYPSARQRILAEALQSRGYELIEEFAIGPYNVDIALTGLSVAVEVLGGGWHANKPIHRIRSPYILDAGWHLIMVWDLASKDFAVGPHTADHVIAFAKEAGSDPSGPRQYRVIRSDGYLCATRTEGDDLPLVCPTVRKVYRCS